MLDFVTTKKRVFPVRFRDGKIIKVYMPTKGIFDLLSDLQKQMLDGVEIDNADALKNVYGTLSVIASHNEEGAKIPEGYLEKMLDYEDVQTFFVEYMKFVTGEISDPD